MKALVKKRARITRVREAQHLLAVSVAASAEAQVVSLETNAAKLASLRDSLTLPTGPSTGAVLQNRGTLAQRLDNARHGLNSAIASAKATAEQKVTERLEARQRQESAAKLDARAVKALQDWTEARMAAAFRPRNSRNEGES
jgi:dsDNA-specific endonuclease/ATPase MutS2